MVLQSVKNIVENTQWKMHDFDSEYVFSTSSVKYVVENERSPPESCVDGAVTAVGFMLNSVVLCWQSVFEVGTASCTI